MKKKFNSIKLQNYLALVPYFGMLIVFFMGMFNVYNIKKSRLHLVLYMLLLCLPAILFGCISILVFSLWISVLENFTLQIILAFVLTYIIMLMFALSIIGIQKGMIERLYKFKDLDCNETDGSDKN